MLEKQRKEGVKVRLSGTSVAASDAIPRHGTPVLSDGKPIATVTSGGMSPTLHHDRARRPTGGARHARDSGLSLDARGRLAPAEVVKLPFVTAARKAA